MATDTPATTLRVGALALGIASALLLSAAASAQTQQMTFDDSAGMLLIQVRPEATGDFESAMAQLKQALATSPDARRRQIGEGLHFFRSHQPMAANVLYVVMVSPVVRGSNYSLPDLIQETLPSRQDVLRKFVGSVATGLNKLDLRPLFAAGAAATTGMPAPAPAAAPEQIDTSGIPAFCAKEWPDDFAMREFCQKQQREAAAALSARPMPSGDFAMIRNKCSKDWPDDFTMRNFCEEQQLKARAAIKR